MIKAECTWGEGPDVFVVLDNKDHETDQGFGLSSNGPGKSSFGLSARASRRLAEELIAAAEKAEAYEYSYAEYQQRERQKNESGR